MIGFVELDIENTSMHVRLHDSMSSHAKETASKDQPNSIPHLAVKTRWRHNKANLSQASFSKNLHETHLRCLAAANLRSCGNQSS